MDGLKAKRQGSERSTELEDGLAHLDDVAVVQGNSVHASVTAIDARTTSREAILNEVTTFAVEQHGMFARYSVVIDADLAVQVATNGVASFKEFEVDTHIIECIGDQPAYQFA